MKKAIQIPNAPAPVGPYSQAILAGGMLFVSGQIPLNPETGELEMGSIEVATHRVMKNIVALLEAAELNIEQVVKTSIFLKDLNDFQAVNTIYASYFPGIPPARETVQVVRLPLDVNIEISCIVLANG
jgi:2-iminobutanoate/2-iminopropanoate deaminase